MDRRLISVIGLSLLFALVVAGVFYQVVAGAGQASKPQKVETRDVVVAARSLPAGVSIKPADLKVTKMPAAQAPPGVFARPEELLDRPVVSTILPDEPVREGRVAPRGTGLGLAPVIPAGMRAVSVRVNEVVGVAGFVLPGMRVDVLVTGKPPGHEETQTNTVLQNILVLSAGQQIEPDARGQAINTPVVTLLVTPEQAETLTLAGNEGRIQLVLRNAGDQGIQKTPGRRVSHLFGGRGAASRRAATEQPGRVIVFRGNKRTVEGYAGSALLQTASAGSSQTAVRVGAGPAEAKR